MISHDRFPITLVFPPQGHFTQPYLALPCIKAWLVEHGFPDVALLDLSIEAYDHFLTRAYLERAMERVAERLPLGRAGDERLGFRDLEAFRAAAESAASGRALAERIEDAKACLRGEAFFDMDTYAPAVRTIYHSLRLVSAAHFPAQLTPHNFTTGYANDRSREVLAATIDDRQNPFLAYFEEEVLPALIERRPRLVGMSVIYGSQLVPALTLGRLVKRSLPDCHVTAGGGFLAYIGDKLLAAPGMNACFDSLVFHEGEAPMLALAEALQSGSDLDGVGSLGWFDASGRSVRNAPAHPIKLDDAPVPDFDGLPFEKYLSPEIVIPYDVNRGCYYGECTFCTLPTVIGPGYRTRSAQTIADHVVKLRDRHGARNFNFITDCMPPGMIRDLPDELVARRAGVRWWADARVEPKAYTPEGARRLYESGCRKLLFGFETATPRLLKMMKKGQGLKSVVDVARNCAEADISVTFYAMVGFPSETLEEARATLDFLLANKDVVREVSLQTFHIDEVAQTYKQPEQFGIEILDEPDADLALYHDYESSAGMTQEEAAAAFEEMMAAFRRELPIFAGDNIFYFMQKSHYFLHLARGTTPDAFAEGCRRRARKADEQSFAGREEALAPAPGLVHVELPFSYKDAVERLADPLARAVRPDFLTGRYVRGAEERAEARLGSLSPARRVLLFEPRRSEFCEITPDGARLVDAIERAGSVGELLDRSGAGPEAREKVLAFARRLGALGMLVPRSPVPVPAR